MHFIEIAPGLYVCCEHITAITSDMDQQAMGSRVPMTWVYTTGGPAHRSTMTVSQLVKKIREATA